LSREAKVCLSSTIANVSVYEDYSYLVAVYPFNLIDESNDSRNNSSLVSIPKSTDLVELRVFTHCIQCPNITVVAYISTFLKLDDVNRNAIEQSTGLISARTTADVFLHLSLNTQNTIVCPQISFSVCAYLEASGCILKVFKCIIA
jgi:hypothetical protein